MNIPPLEEQQNPVLPAEGAGPKLWGWHTFLSIAVTTAVFALLASYVDLAQVWREVVASDKQLLLLAALSHYATYPVRGARWRRCLQHIPGRCGSGRFGLLAFFFLFVDNMVPAKLGDIYAAHLARINCGVRRSAALGSIAFQRTVGTRTVSTSFYTERTCHPISSISSRRSPSTGPPHGGTMFPFAHSVF